MPLTTLFFVGWLAFMALRGWFRGFWPMLGGLLGLITAYVLALWLAPSTAPSLEALGVPPGFSLGVAASLIWLVTAFLFSLIFKLLSSPLVRRQGLLGNIGGAAIGMAFGAVTGLFAVWGLGLIKDIAIERTGSSYSQPPSVLDGLAANFVSRATEAGMSLAGASDALKDLTGAVMRQPAKLMNSARDLAQTPALQALLADPEAQKLMRAQDSEGLQKTAAFKELLKTPEAESRLATLSDDGEQNAQYMQEKLADISIKVQQVRDDPEVAALAQDPEVVQLMEEQNAWKLLSHPKIQKLWALLSREKLDVPSGEEATTAEQASDARIYQWYDDEGELHYSDHSAIPLNKRDSAVEMSR